MVDKGRRKQKEKGAPRGPFFDYMFRYLASLLYIALGLSFYTQVSVWHVEFLNRFLAVNLCGLRFYFTVFDVFVWAVIAYAVLLPFYYLDSSLESKALMAFRAIWGWFRGGYKLNSDERRAARILVLKFFFVPLMLSWLAQHLAGFSDLATYSMPVAGDGADWISFYNLHVHARLLHLVIFVDVLLFTLGYLIEHPRLNNTFVSVDPTIGGWLACLICYPPFNEGLHAFIGWYSSDAPKVGDPSMQFVLNLLVMVAFIVYSAASVNLGFKASNLTNRGIVRHGMYRWIRHPAYTFKNLAWWLGAMPPLWAALQTSVLGSIAILLSLCGWTAIYVARALTEERHLLMADNGYREYMQQVRYRFIPGLV